MNENLFFLKYPRELKDTRHSFLLWRNRRHFLGYKNTTQYRN